MGNAMFSTGSYILDLFGYGVQKNDEPDGVTDSEDDDDHIEHDKVEKDLEKMIEYCKPLLFTNFCGQASGKEDTDSNTGAEALNIGIYLSLLDKLVRQYPKADDFTVEDPNFRKILRGIADKRHREEEKENKCYKRLLRDSKRFEKIYKERAAKHPDNQHSEILKHQDYWGTRQQLLSAKVICDWLSEDGLPPMDPIFGVLLQPTAGRVGPGDSGWFHNVLYDNCGEWAHHSAVHDAFGYLLNLHQTGPGYNYMYKSFFNKDNPMAGQISGIAWWKEYVQEVQTKLKVVEAFKNI